ncbi:MAG: serine hydrolase [Anaerolineae bacterium]|nr:serine hydrolase [Anaerolineae bacterium]MDW8171448.1 serine hydrolase [Anaerolineae bacterium]
MRIVLISLALLIGASLLLAQSNVTAEAIGQANVRASVGVDALKVGEISSGTRYPVIGRSEFFPWVLIADPVTLRPLGWVFQDLVTIQGNLNSVPLSSQVIDPNALPTPMPTLAIPALTLPTSPILATPSATPAQPTPTLASNVIGTVKGEVNIRYGPGINYPRLGVAQAGERFAIVGYHTQFPWAQVAYANSPNGRAWIALDLLEVQGNIFSQPAISDAVLNLPTLTPTPSVITSVSIDGQQAVAISPSFAALGNQLYDLFLRGKFDPATSRFGALFLMDLQTGETLTFGDNIAFSGTSVMKIAILARLYGTLSAPPDERTATDIANTMICSENGATNRLLALIGSGDEWNGALEVTRFMNVLGLESSFITSPYIVDPSRPPVPPRPIPIPTTSADQKRANPDFSNQTTVSEMGLLLASMYQCAYQDRGPLIENPALAGAYEPRECRQMLHVMSNNTVDALLKAGVPVETRVAHKHGWIADTHSNAAIFFTPNRDYIMVAFMHQPSWLNFAESLPIIAESSRQVYNYYNPQAPQPAVRAGFIPEAPTCNFANTPLILDLRQPVWDR